MTIKKISVESYGCTMNSGEARRASSLLSDIGYDMIPLEDGQASEEAEAVILFTCDVITSTEKRMFRRMDEIAKSGKKLFVAGCLASIDGQGIIERYPGAMILDTMGMDRVEDAIRKTFDSIENENKISVKKPDRLDHIVPIASGCVGSCTYCITREARGSHISSTPEEILKMVHKGIDDGKSEILMTSQDTGAYGIDLSPAIDLGSMLNRITANIQDDIRIRVGMMNPNLLLQRLDSILDGYDDDRIFKFFHIPFQSGSDRILELMGRRYRSKDIHYVIKAIRTRFPGATISTDVISGFPTETEGDHRKSMEMINIITPDILNITRFSRRKGTPADSMAGQVHGSISKERSREFTRSHREIVQDNLRSRLSTHRSCLVTETGREDTMMARDENYTPIVIKGERSMLGAFVDIETFEIGPSYLIGRKIN